MHINFINQLLESFKKINVYSSFRGNIWGVDLTDMQLISKFNKGIRVLLGVIGKYAWAIPLKDKKPATIVNSFHISTIDYSMEFHSKIKPNKIG